MSKKLKYKLGDVVYLKKRSDPREVYSLPKKTKFTIKTIDYYDDECPYLVEFITLGGRLETYWLTPEEIKCLASVIQLGGE